ncbi:hypothetical protein T484DRAFT_2956554 [Baffinella frigidus]|nr:hypothetical protein T484DRAFT_2956554 [Cryptophyta sp. CCMP2293]
MVGTSNWGVEGLGAPHDHMMDTVDTPSSRGQPMHHAHQESRRQSISGDMNMLALGLRSASAPETRELNRIAKISAAISFLEVELDLNPQTVAALRGVALTKNRANAPTSAPAASTLQAPLQFSAFASASNPILGLPKTGPDAQPWRATTFLPGSAVVPPSAFLSQQFAAQVAGLHQHQHQHQHLQQQQQQLEQQHATAQPISAGSNAFSAGSNTFSSRAIQVLSHPTPQPTPSPSGLAPPRCACWAAGVQRALAAGTRRDPPTRALRTALAASPTRASSGGCPRRP